MKEIFNKLFDAIEAVSLDQSHLSIYNIVNKGSHLIVTIDGGANGNGDWLTYIKQVGSIIKRLAPARAWIINWKNDPIDDVWRLQLGIDLTGGESAQSLG